MDDPEYPDMSGVISLLDEQERCRRLIRHSHHNYRYAVKAQAMIRRLADALDGLELGYTLHRDLIAEAREMIGKQE